MFFLQVLRSQVSNLAICDLDFGLHTKNTWTRAWVTKCTNLKELNLHCQTWSGLHPIWKHLGGNLESLKIQVDPPVNADFDNAVEVVDLNLNSIKTNCVGPKDVDIYDRMRFCVSDVNEKKLAYFLGSFGAQLEGVDFTFWVAMLVQRLITRTPTFSFLICARIRLMDCCQ